VEKNPTIVMFPVKNFDLSSYVFPEGGRKQVPTEEEVRGMSTKELKRLLTTYGREDVANNAIEKDELLQHCLDFVSTSLPDLLADKYDLVANITHDIPAEVGREGTKHNPLEEGTYRCHVQHKATGQWYEMQDLEVTETMPQLIGVSESYLLIFERKGAQL
jgi:U4/U6.U5 tri-snRNP-associated protein 2